MDGLSRPNIPNDMQLGEDRIKVLQTWISQLCDPDINFSLSLHNTFQTTCESAAEQSYEGGGGSYTQLTNKKLPFKIKEDEVQDGPVYTKLLDGSIIEGNMKKGLPHGYFRCINSSGDVDLFCCFVRGILHGPCWRGLVGGGFLVSNTLDFSSPAAMYLYPDCRTVLFGNFYQSQMVGARLCEVIGSSGHCSYFCGVLKPIVSQPGGPIFSYDPSTSIRISSEPLLPDPYEMEFVEVRPSKIEGAGEGLFAKVDIEVGTIVSFYNGTRVEPVESSDIIHKEAYRIALDDQFDLDIPEDMVPTDQYKGTLSHKVCHSFSPNTEFESFQHPRFDIIKCLTTIRSIREGDELLVNYRYNIAVSPNWYKVAWAKHQKVVRGLPNWKLAVNFGSFSRHKSADDSEGE